MRKVLWRIVPAAALVAAVMSAAEPPGLEEGAEAFYAVATTTAPRGVPTGAALERFRPVISARLRASLERAGAAEADHAARTRHESPPLVEGDIFTSLFEGASRFRIESCAGRPAAGTCVATLTYLDPSGAAPLEWHDIVHLVSEDGRWRVDDVEYGGTWQFMHRGRLSSVLAGAIADSAPR